MKEIVTLKGYRDCIVINIAEEVPFEELRDTVISKFEKSKEFFKNHDITVDFSGVKYENNDYMRLIESISKVTECEVKRLDIGIEFIDRDYVNKDAVFSVDGNTKFHRGTLRSGQTLTSNGSIVVIGDVNPAAEIKAVGNIVIIGTARGILHAGSQGNRDAFITAIHLQPTQLRIADMIARPPDGENLHNRQPEIAYIMDDQIEIDLTLKGTSYPT